MTQKCSVKGCAAPADVEVLLCDEYVDGEKFREQDFTCPHLCEQHRQENEKQAVGIRRPRGVVDYPYTNAHGAQGWSEYRRLR
jgi:hypothetical protein